MFPVAFDINRCRSVEFDGVQFLEARGKETSVEGKVTEIVYTLDEGQKDRTRLQIAPN